MNAPIDISGVTLRTPRLLLRPWQESDLDDFYEYASVDGVGQMAGWLPHKDKAESARILKMFIDEKKTLALEFEGKRSLAPLASNDMTRKSCRRWRPCAAGKSAMFSPKIIGDGG